MSNPPSLLESLDTTVTLEWDDTRTIGTLVQLGGRRVVITALRAPEVGKTVFLRVEEESTSEAIAVDGTCAGVHDSEWGEQEVQVDVQRVGTTSSAAALRSFIERHGIERGGTVSVGRNRDNPDLKRFVYLLPDATYVEPAPVLPAVVPPRTNPAPNNESTAAYAPSASKTLEFQPPGAFASSSWTSARGLGVDLRTQPSVVTGSVAQEVSVPDSRPTEPATPAAAMLQEAALDQDAELERLLASFSVDDRPTQNSTPAVHIEEPERPAPVTHAYETIASVAPAVKLPPAAPAAAAQRQLPPMPKPNLTDVADATRAMGIPAVEDAAEDHDDSEQILVQIVDQSSQMAAPVMQVPGRSAADKGPIASRLFGKKDEPHPSAHRISEPASVGVAAAQLFTGEQALRVDLPVTFEAGPKKKKYKGMLLRLGESKLRVRATTLPEMYERVTVFVPGKGGAKDLLTIKCEVTRVKTGESDGGDPCFDARLTSAGNPPTVMAKLRKLLEDQSSGPA